MENIINSSYQPIPIPAVSLTLDDVMREMSFYILPSQLLIYPYNPDDLVIKKGLFIYDRMKDDEIIKVALLLKKTVMLSNRIEVKAVSTDPADVMAADFVKHVLFEELEQPLNLIIEQVLSAFDYGYSVSEKIFEYIDNGPFAGKIGLKNIKTKPPHGFDFKTDVFGSLLYVRQFQGTAYGHDIAPNKFLIHTINKQFGSVYGISDLRGVYRPWWTKDVVLKFLAMHLERYGTPLILARYKGTLNKQEKADLTTLLKFIQTGTGFMIPDDKAIIEKVEFGKAEGYVEALDRFDKMITRGLLMPDHLGFTNTTSGSYALGQEQFGLFYLILQKYYEDLLLDLKNQVVKPLVEYNFGIKRAPLLQLVPAKPENLAELTDIYTKITTSGYMSPNNKSDMDFVRSKYGLPSSDPQATSNINLSSDSKGLLTSIKQNETDFQKLLADIMPKIAPNDYKKFIDAYKAGNIEDALTAITKYNPDIAKDKIAEVLKQRFADGMRAAQNG